MKKYYLVFLIIHATASCFSQSEKDSILIKNNNIKFDKNYPLIYLLSNELVEKLLITV